MGSSSSDDYSTPPQQPAPPGNLIQPYGASTPDRGWQGMNFLGNRTSTLADIDAMQPQFAAMSAPPAAPPAAAAAAGQARPALSPDQQRAAFANIIAGMNARAPAGISYQLAEPGALPGVTPQQQRRFGGSGGMRGTGGSVGRTGGAY